MNAKVSEKNISGVTSDVSSNEDTSNQLKPVSFQLRQDQYLDLLKLRADAHFNHRKPDNISEFGREAIDMYLDSLPQDFREL